MAYRHIVFSEDPELLSTEGMETLIYALETGGYQIGMIGAEKVKTCEEQDLDDCLLTEYIQRFGADRREVLYIGSSMHDMESASGSGVDCGLAVWRCENPRHTWATYYFTQPYDIWNQLMKDMEPFEGKEWIAMAMELQFLAQAGLTYTRDIFDKERFTRVREIAAEAMALGTGLPVQHVADVFCNETGFQTPKLDSRAAVFQDDKILLVREKSGLWSLPGGWVDVNQSIAGNTVKEVKEEAGLDVIPVRLIALHDRNRHNIPVYAYGICKAFMLCEVISGTFEENDETDASGYFGIEELPPLAVEKTTVQQVQMCFEAYHNKQWNPVVD